MKKKKSKNLNNSFGPRMQKKLFGSFILIVIIFAFLIFRISYINATNGSKYKKHVLEQQNYDSKTIPFKRGSITDRNGNVMAYSRNVYNVILDAKVLNDTPSKIPATKKMLKNIFGIKGESVDKILTKNPDSRYSILLKKVEYDIAQKFVKMQENKKEASKYAGIWLEDNFVRTYPYNEYASAALGFVSDGNVGAFGIEQYYNSVLNGTNGREYGVYESSSNGIKSSTVDAVNGNNVVSTIDINVQKAIEERVAQFNSLHINATRKGLGANHISVIAMNPNNGEILGMESFPNYNLNKPTDLKRLYDKKTLKKMSSKEKKKLSSEAWKNFCISDAYEPGSTAKPFTVSAGLEDGKLSGLESYECYGSLHVGDRDIHCHETSGHGYVDLPKAISSSCNVALMNVALTLGQDEFSRYQHIFGFGNKTNIDLPGEGVGSLYTPEEMSDVDLASNSFGQNFTCTQIQMAAAYCSLINGGNYYKPHVVKQIQDEKGNTIEEFDKELIRKTVSTNTSNTLKDYMLGTVTNGTGTYAAISGYDLAGKTGTAETLPRGNNEYIISFCGFAPYNDPEVLIYAVIDRPNYEDQEATSLVMGLVHDICMDIFPYLGITMNAEDFGANVYKIPERASTSTILDEETNEDDDANQEISNSDNNESNDAE